MLGGALKRVIGTVVVAAFVTGGGLAASSAGGPDGLVRSEFRVTSDEGVRVAVREVNRPAAGQRSVLLLHGARVPGAASFDLPVPGGSLAADLANAGYRVYVMDARGYGDSTRPAELSQDPAANPPAVRADAVVRDVAAVVDRITSRSGGQVALLGWATGGQWLGQYAAANPSKVSHLVLYNSLYGPIDGHPTMGRGSGYEDPQRPGRFNTARFGAYRCSTGASLLPSWDSGIPVEDKSVWRDPAVVDAYVKGALASDPTSANREPTCFRSPSGAVEDSFALATGRQLWDAGFVTAHTLILRSEYDFWSRPEDPRKLAEHLVHAASVRQVEIPGATHYVHLDRAERGRDRFLSEIVSFLGR